jgi:hypothetical protein
MSMRMSYISIKVHLKKVNTFNAKLTLNPKVTRDAGNTP